MRDYFMPVIRLLESRPLIKCQGSMVIVLRIERNLGGVDLLAICNYRCQQLLGNSLAAPRR